MYFNVDI